MKLIYLLMICAMLINSSMAFAEHYAQEFIDDYFTSVCAGSCLGVYRPNDSAEFDYMRSYGWQVTPYTVKSGSDEAHFAMSYSYFEELDQDIYVLAIRGSASKGDYRLDLKTRKIAYEQEDAEFLNQQENKKFLNDYPLVHLGFNTYTDIILKNYVFDEHGNWTGDFAKIMQNPRARLYITGHSLGGAVATLLGERLVSAGMPKEKFHVITFGAPAIGNKVFVARYGDRIRLRRVTNTNDPVPGGLQTFFDNYQQFGENVKYHLSPKIKSVQHDITMYFDYSVKESYKAYDKQIALGNIPADKTEYFTPGVPVVALWLNASKHMREIAYITDTARMIRDEYTELIPSYIIMSEKLDVYNIGRYDIINESRKAGADYVLVVNIDGSKSQTLEYHYLALEQALFDKDGNLITMTNVSKKVSPSVGNIQAAEENFFQARDILLEKLPFLIKTRTPSLLSGH